MVFGAIIGSSFFILNPAAMGDGSQRLIDDCLSVVEAHSGETAIFFTDNESTTIGSDCCTALPESSRIESIVILDEKIQYNYGFVKSDVGYYLFPRFGKRIVLLGRNPQSYVIIIPNEFLMHISEDSALQIEVEYRDLGMGRFLVLPGNGSYFAWSDMEIKTTFRVDLQELFLLVRPDEEIVKFSISSYTYYRATDAIDEIKQVFLRDAPWDRSTFNDSLFDYGYGAYAYSYEFYTQIENTVIAIYMDNVYLNNKYVCKLRSEGATKCGAFRFERTEGLLTIGKAE